MHSTYSDAEQRSSLECVAAVLTSGPAAQPSSAAAPATTRTLATFVEGVATRMANIYSTRTELWRGSGKASETGSLSRNARCGRYIVGTCLGLEGNINIYYCDLSIIGYIHKVCSKLQ